MSPSVDQRISALAGGQWGMLTTGQARLHGVARAVLAKREKQGSLERIAHGVYRLAGAPASPLDDLRAAWLATNPEVTADERLEAGHRDPVVASAAAALVHHMGNVYPAPYRMIVSGRRQSRKGDVAYSQRNLDPADVQIVDGLPVTSRERTLLDLLDDEGDRSIVADALRDAAAGPYDLDEDRLAVLLAPRAASLGLPTGNGVAVVEDLKRIARVDAQSQAVDAIARVGVARTDLVNLQHDVAAIVQAIATSPAMEALTRVDSKMTAIANSAALDALRQNQAVINALLNGPAMEVLMANQAALRGESASESQSANDANTATDDE